MPRGGSGGTAGQLCRGAAGAGRLSGWLRAAPALFPEEKPGHSFLQVNVVVSCWAARVNFALGPPPAPGGCCCRAPEAASTPPAREQLRAAFLGRVHLKGLAPEAASSPDSVRTAPRQSGAERRGGCLQSGGEHVRRGAGRIWGSGSGSGRAIKFHIAAQARGWSSGRTCLGRALLRAVVEACPAAPSAQNRDDSGWEPAETPGCLEEQLMPHIEGHVCISRNGRRRSCATVSLAGGSAARVQVGEGAQFCPSAIHPYVQ